MTKDRIASMLASSTEILYGLGLGDRVVSVSHECDFPRGVERKPRVTRTRVNVDASSRAIDEQVRTQFAQSLPLYEIDVELLASLRPDLIVTQAQCDVCAVRFDDVVCATRENVSLASTTIVALNPTSLNEIFADIQRVGEAAGAAEAAKEWVDGLRGRVEAVRNVTHNLTDDQRPRVVGIEWIDPVMVAANWTPELIEIAGGKCEIATAGQPSRMTDWTAIAEYEPEVIIVMPCGFGLDRAITESEMLSSVPEWDDLPAVRNGRVFAADGNAYFNRSGPRIVDTVEMLAHICQPDPFQNSAIPSHTDAWQKLSSG